MLKPNRNRTFLFLILSILLCCKRASSGGIPCDLKDAPQPNAEKFNAFALTEQPGSTGIFALTCNSGDTYLENPCPGKFQLSTSRVPVSTQTVYQPSEDGLTKVKIIFYFFRKNVDSVDVSIVCKQ